MIFLGRGKPILPPSRALAMARSALSDSDLVRASLVLEEDFFIFNVPMASATASCPKEEILFKEGGAGAAKVLLTERFSNAALVALLAFNRRTAS